MPQKAEISLEELDLITGPMLLWAPSRRSGPLPIYLVLCVSREGVAPEFEP